MAIERHVILPLNLGFARAYQAVQERLPSVASKILFQDQFHLQDGKECAEWLVATGFHTGLGEMRWIVTQPSYNVVLVKLKSDGLARSSLFVLAAGSESWVLQWDFGRNDAILRKFLGPLTDAVRRDAA